MLARQVANSKRPITTAGAVTRISSRWFMRRLSFPDAWQFRAHYTTASCETAGGVGCAGTARAKSDGRDWQIAKYTLRLNVEEECPRALGALSRKRRETLAS